MLAGHLIEQGGWRCLELPAITLDDEVIPLGRGLCHIVGAPAMSSIPSVKVARRWRRSESKSAASCFRPNSSKDRPHLAVQ